MLTLQIDVRESHFIADLDAQLPSYPLMNDVTIEKSNLPIGDFIILDQDKKEMVIIERKSIADLLSSITDGRYAEQSFRLKNTNTHSHNIIYLIEGIPTKKEIPKVYACITSLSLIKGFSVIRTTSLTDTITFILNMTCKLKRDIVQNKKQLCFTSSENINPDDGEKQYIEHSSIKRIKKDNITANNIDELMLCQIPGISANIAKALIASFQSLINLIEEIKTNPKLLESFKISSSDGKQKKLNKNIGPLIYQFLIKLPYPAE